MASAASLAGNCTISTLLGIDAVLLQDHLEQIDIGVGPADHADAAAGELLDLGDLRAGFLALLGLGRRRHPQHRDVLAQRRHGLRIFRHIEIAADDGEIGLAVGKRLGARDGAIGLHGTQPHRAMRKRLRQRLDDLDVVAVRRSDRDPQRDRTHREVICGADSTHQRQGARQRDEHHLPLHRTGRRRRRRPGKVGAVLHRSGKKLLQAQIRHARRYISDGSKYPAIGGITSASWLPSESLAPALARIGRGTQPGLRHHGPPNALPGVR